MRRNKLYLVSFKTRHLDRDEGSLSKQFSQPGVGQGQISRATETARSKILQYSPCILAVTDGFEIAETNWWSLGGVDLYKRCINSIKRRAGHQTNNQHGGFFPKYNQIVL
jgi:hypothetical protein